MRRTAAILCCAGAALFWESAIQAQEVTSLDKLPAAARMLEDGGSHEPLPCSVHAVKPKLNFGFRFQTGYTFETSLDPYLDRQHRWYIVFRVTPENNAGPPVYFLDSMDPPARSRSGLIGQEDGTFQTGEGRYQVKWALIDDQGRVCRQEWTIDAHPAFSERSGKVAMRPGTVGDFSSRSAASAPAVTKSRRVTILLNAAMPVLRRAGQPSNSWGMLLSMLTSIMEQMPEAAFRVVAFDTEQQRELFRKDGFNAADMNDVARVSNAKQHWAVDYRTLQKPAGGWDLLRDLVNKELDAPSPAEAVIFLGVTFGRFENMPAGMPGPATAPRFFYLRYGNPRMPGPGAMVEGTRIGVGTADVPTTYSIAPRAANAADRQDLIELSVRRLKGKTFLISSPANFSKALAAIRR